MQQRLGTALMSAAAASSSSAAAVLLKESVALTRSGSRRALIDVTDNQKSVADAPLLTFEHLLFSLCLVDFAPRGSGESIKTNTTRSSRLHLLEKSDLLGTI